jgi:hypothetical protein
MASRCAKASCQDMSTPHQPLAGRAPKAASAHQEAKRKARDVSDRALDKREAMYRAEDDACREIAEKLEQRHPQWIVIFGTFAREFICLPRVCGTSGIEGRSDISQRGSRSDVEDGAALQSPRRSI